MMRADNGRLRLAIGMDKNFWGLFVSPMKVRSSLLVQDKCRLGLGVVRM